MMKSYHEAWLSAHPYRSAEWLSHMLKQGFDVHHMDGDHSNDDPANLVLIEIGDHGKLHSSPFALRRLHPVASKRGQMAYEMRISGKRWREVCAALGNGALAVAKTYAEANDREWPPFVSLPHPRTGQRRMISEPSKVDALRQIVDG